MAAFIGLFIVDMLFAVLYIIYGYPNITKPSFFYKMLASAIFVINGILAYQYSAKGIYSKIVILGLVLGFIGDAFLAIDPFLKGKLKEKKAAFGVIGGASFFLGHISYIIAFTFEIKKENAFKFPIFIAAWLLLLGTGIAIKAALKVKLGKFAFPVLTYAIAISAMCSFGICLAICHTSNPLLVAVLTVGPFFFVFSDATIVLRMFYKEKYENIPMRFANLLTYFIAQMLFGLSILMIK